jgi:curved DNA-binding protein CbpA
LDKHYDVLNVSPNASDKEIRQRWIELMKSNHPDKVGQGGLNRAKKINEAYEVLSSSKKIIDYDFKYLPNEPVIVKDGGMGSVSKMFSYFVPFILVIAVSYLYLSSSGLLFKSEAEKEGIAKNIENLILTKIDMKSEKYYTELEPESKLIESEKLAQKSENIATNDKIENKSPNINKDITLKRLSKRKSNSSQEQTVALNTENKEQENISKQNILTNNKLDVGEELLIPESNLKSNKKYVVKSGDTLSQIAEKFGVKTKDLKNTKE